MGSKVGERKIRDVYRIEGGREKKIASDGRQGWLKMTV